MATDQPDTRSTLPATRAARVPVTGEPRSIFDASYDSVNPAPKAPVMRARDERATPAVATAESPMGAWMSHAKMATDSKKKR